MTAVTERQEKAGYDKLIESGVDFRGYAPDDVCRLCVEAQFIGMSGVSR